MIGGSRVKKQGRRHLRPRVDTAWNFYLHKSCFELSCELHHPLHRIHPLVLTKDRPYPYHLICHHCKDFINWSNSFFYYRCLRCDFNLHLGCASLPPLPHTMEVQIRDHSLSLIRKLITFTCDACGKEGKDMPYLCLTCAFCVHPICVSLHCTVKHGLRIWLEGRVLASSLLLIGRLVLVGRVVCL